MADVIQCPTCSKKYKLPAVPPPTFQCKACGTVMDLSAFQAPAAPEPAAPAAPARAGRAEAPRGGGPAKHHGRHGRAAAHGRARAGGARHDRGARDEVEEGEEERPHWEPKKSNAALLWGSLGAVAVAIVALVLLMSGKEKPVEKVEAPPPPVVAPPPMDIPDDEEEDEVKKAPPKPPEGLEDETRPELRQGKLEDVPIPAGKRKYGYHQAEIKEYPWPEYVTGEEKAQIEEAIAKLANGGRDQTEGEEFLAKIDAYPAEGTQFKAVGRLISEFKRIMDEFGGDLGNPMTMARLMVVDRILRHVDGFQERDFADRDGIKHSSTDTHAKTVMRRWNWWYDLEKWRMRRVPWDDREDSRDMDEEDEMEAMEDE
jgi:hypothetical protein